MWGLIYNRSLLIFTWNSVCDFLNAQLILKKDFLVFERSKCEKDFLFRKLFYRHLFRWSFRRDLAKWTCIWLMYLTKTCETCSSECQILVPTLPVPLWRLRKIKKRFTNFFKSYSLSCVRLNEGARLRQKERKMELREGKVKFSGNGYQANKYLVKKMSCLRAHKNYLSWTYFKN